MERSRASAPAGNRSTAVLRQWVVDADGRDLRSDEVLLVAIGDADRGALTALDQRHAAWLTVRLTHRCGDPDVVDLALHDTFMAVWRKPRSYRGSGEFAAWLWGIAVRRLLDQLRRRPALAYLPTIEQLVVSAEDEVLAGLHHGELASALDRLSLELLSVVQATVLDGPSTLTVVNWQPAARLMIAGLAFVTIGNRSWCPIALDDRWSRRGGNQRIPARRSRCRDARFVADVAADATPAPRDFRRTRRRIVVGRRCCSGNQPHRQFPYFRTSVGAWRARRRRARRVGRCPYR